MTSDPFIGYASHGLRFVALIGQGGMGAVYRGIDQTRNRPVAIKVLAPHLFHDSTIHARFQREALTLGALDHPHVVRCYDQRKIMGPQGHDVLVLIMELVEGHSVGQHLRRGCPVGVAMGWLQQAALGLQAAHALDLVHRDVKPDNMLVGKDGLAKLADFGLARFQTRIDHQVTRHGALVGSPAYLSPETCRGEEAGAAADMYAMGVSIFQVAAGELPFRADNPLRLMQQHLHHPAPRLGFRRPALAALEPLVQSCLSKLPHERPTAAQVAAELARIIPTLPAAAHPTQTRATAQAPTAQVTGKEGSLSPSVKEISGPHQSKHRATLWVGALVATLGFGVFMGSWWRNHQATTRQTPATSGENFNETLAQRLDTIEQQGRIDPDLGLTMLDGLLVPENLTQRRDRLEKDLRLRGTARWEQHLDQVEIWLNEGQIPQVENAQRLSIPDRYGSLLLRDQELRRRFQERTAQNAFQPRALSKEYFAWTMWLWRQAPGRKELSGGLWIERESVAPSPVMEVFSGDNPHNPRTYNDLDDLGQQLVNSQEAGETMAIIVTDPNVWGPEQWNRLAALPRRKLLPVLMLTRPISASAGALLMVHAPAVPTLVIDGLSEEQQRQQSAAALQLLREMASQRGP